MTNDSEFDTEDHPPFAPNPESGPRRAAPLGTDSREQQRRYGNKIAIMVALVGFGLLAVLILGCSGGNPVVLLLLAGIVGILLLHYFTWGRLLNRTDSQAEDISARK